MGSGKTGLLNSQDVEPYLEINTYNHSPLMRNKQRMTRRGMGGGIGGEAVLRGGDVDQES